ncbi:hypothetical protein EOI86_01135 [Hwanghaeella grinnelliae]|uniref:Lipoprotein n=1 Tax=Hwanghaeella grinnelliae TaxID=2500179 RepID=A0A3S2W5V9_9PROT|nr:hypothetical protein [Hwanghaeella grinnelliae]RVU37939.1 hypothetical protein EOI86_01135 [Hwanghaeella grinnelliae]
MNGRHTMTFLAVMVLMTACARDPSITTSDVWHSGPNQTAVSVCYSASASTREQVEAVAAEGCPVEKPILRLIDEDSFLNDCPLSKRIRATFLCVAP